MPSFLSRLFGTSPAAPPAPILHKDFRIFPAPNKDGGAFRIAARIEKDFATGVKTHNLIRADTCTSQDEAAGVSLVKAKQAIDQLGDTLFG